MIDSNKQDNADFFVAKYAQPRKTAARAVERSVLGHDVGLNGYTTIEQARALAETLQLMPTSRLLEVGGGRGWPGLYLAEKSHCQLVATDITFGALQDTKIYAAARGLQTTTSIAAADGLALPFRPACFDSIVHADVF